MPGNLPRVLSEPTIQLILLYKLSSLHRQGPQDEKAHRPIWTVLNRPSSSRPRLWCLDRRYRVGELKAIRRKCREMGIVAWLEHRSRWSVLRGLGNSSIAKATIAVPLVGYLLLFNGEIVKFLSLHTDFCRSASCGPSLRLLLLYLGCCSIAVGAALYGLKCPALIKKYDSAAAFFEAEKVYFCQPRNLDYLQRLIELGTETNPLAQNAPVFSYNGRSEVDPNSLADPMGELYRVLNVSDSKFRIAAFTSYYLGIIIFLIPTAMTFFQVVFTYTLA
jgi:hypothetical protein